MKQIFYPHSIEEAAAISAESDGRAVPLGGATSFAFAKVKPSADLIDLSRAKLDYVTTGSHVVLIGSSTTAGELTGNGISSLLPDALVEAAASIGTSQLRNMITVGGNIARVFPWSDLPVPLLAMDAVIIIASPDGERSMRAAGFFSKQPFMVLKPGELIKEIILPAANENPRLKSKTGSAFFKFNRLKRELAYATASAFLRLKDGFIQDASVVVGGLTSLPGSIEGAVELLIGREPEEVNEKALAQTVASSVKPIRDHRASREYRAHIAGVLAGRAVSRALERAVSSPAADKKSSKKTGDGGAIQFVKKPDPSPGAGSLPDAGKSPSSGIGGPDAGDTGDKQSVKFILNGSLHEFRCDPSAPLLDLLRGEGLSGSKRGCEDGSCGACTVLMDGRTVLSCLLPAGLVEGREITTIESLGTVAEPHPIQKALVDAGGVQCGYCTPGVVLSVKALLDANPQPTERDLRDALDGNLCRCTGYVKILDGARNAAAVLAGSKGVEK